MLFSWLVNIICTYLQLPENYIICKKNSRDGLINPFRKVCLLFDQCDRVDMPKLSGHLVTEANTYVNATVEYPLMIKKGD